MLDNSSRGIGLIDLRGLSLRDLEKLDDAHLRRVFESLLNDKTEPMAGFSSSLIDSA